MLDRRPHGCGRRAYRDVFTACSASLSQRTAGLIQYFNGGSRPVSRVLSWTAIHLGCTSPCTSSDLPGNSAGHANAPLFGLAPGGVYPATTVASRAVRSYRTISPLPAPKRWRYIFCGTFRRLAPPRRYLAPCPVEPGLSSATEVTAAVWPTSTVILARNSESNLPSCRIILLHTNDQEILE